VAKRFGVEVSTLRWWEKRGLLVPSGRESGRRARLAACEEQQVRLRSAVGGLPIAHNRLSADWDAWTVRGSHGRRRPCRRAGRAVAWAVDRSRARIRSRGPEGEAGRLDLG
jgi:hypothetical protein